MRRYIVIPARMQASRLPGKPLQRAADKTLVQHTYERAMQVPRVDEVIVATPDEEVAAAVQSFGGTACMTSETCLTGTHRVAEVAANLRTPCVVVNWQVDEPLVEPDDVDAIARQASQQLNGIATLVTDLPPAMRQSRNQTKAIWVRRLCLWFSRAYMAGSMAHVGIYAYNGNVLGRLGRLPSSEYSRAESLEQLAWIEAGYLVHGVRIDSLPLAINNPADWLVFKSMIECQ